MAPMMTCMECGKEVKIRPCYVPKFKYCSRECKAKSQINQVNLNCIICGKSFSVIYHRKSIAKYCSKKCYHKGQRDKGTIDKSCPICNNIFKSSPSRNRITCSNKCRGIKYRTEHPKSTNMFGIKRWLNRRNMISVCETCGYDKHPEILHIHHKDNNHDNNELNNLSILCPNCHAIEHLVNN